MIFLQKEPWKDCNQRGEQGGDRRNPARSVASGEGERVREDQWAQANLLVAEGERERAGEVAPRSSRGGSGAKLDGELVPAGLGCLG